MSLFELVIVLLLGASVLALVADRLGLPQPALLALAGAALAFVPGLPRLTVEPSLALALFVAPVLVEAGYDTSLRDLRHNWRPVATLSVSLVIATALAVALVARAVLPDMPFAVALAFGAVVAPPDATSATAILRRLALPHRLAVVLEGESLLNDATALLIWRLALGAAAVGFTWRHALPQFLLAGAGGLLAGYALGRSYLWLTGFVSDLAIGVLMQFLAAFSVWIMADRAGLSAIVTTVIFAVTVARVAPHRQSPRARVVSSAVWAVAVRGLTIFAFVVMALQLQGMAPHLHGRWREFLGFAAAVTAVAIVTRIAWVAAYTAAVRWKNRRFGRDQDQPPTVPSWRAGTLVAWCGMRGIVTLATALALPTQLGDHPFPHRDVLIFAAFVVVLATLVVQGMTVPWLLGRLALPADDTVAREVRRARVGTAHAALSVLQGDGHPAELLRHAYRARLRRTETEQAGHAPPDLATERERAIAAERAELLRLRDGEGIGDAAFHRIEEELDWAEIDAETRHHDS